MILNLKLLGLQFFLHVGLNLFILCFRMDPFLAKIEEKWHGESRMDSQDDPGQKYLVANINVPVGYKIGVLV